MAIMPQASVTFIIAFLVSSPPVTSKTVSSNKIAVVTVNIIIIMVSMFFVDFIPASIA